MNTKGIIKLGLAAIVAASLHTNAVAAEKQGYILTEADIRYCGLIETLAKSSAKGFQTGIPYSKSLAALQGSGFSPETYSNLKAMLDGAHKQHRYFTKELQERVATEYADKWFKACTDAIIEDEEGR